VNEEAGADRPGKRGEAAALSLRLAWRNLWRNGRRTAISLAAVAFATLILVFGVAMQAGGYGAMIDSAVGLYTGHLQIQAKGYREQPQLERLIERSTPLAERVSRLPGVTAVASRAMAFALVSSPTRSYGAEIVGVEPAAEQRVSSLAGTVRSGRYLADAGADEAVVGEVLARNLKLRLGDELTLLGQGKDGSLAVATCTVVGIFASGSTDLDRQMVEIPLASFRRAFALDDEANALVVRASGLDAVAPVGREIAALFGERPELVTLDWSEIEPGLEQAIQLDAAVGWFLYAVLVLVVAFSILNTFIMAVLERTHELGVLIAVGARPGFVGRVLFAESMLLLALGLLLGLGLGAGITAYFGIHGIAFSSSEELLAHWNLPARIHPQLGLRALVVGPAAVLAATTLAALFPLLRAWRLRPVEAMRAP